MRLPSRAPPLAPALGRCVRRRCGAESGAALLRLAAAVGRQRQRRHCRDGRRRAHLRRHRKPEPRSPIRRAVRSRTAIAFTGSANGLSASGGDRDRHSKRARHRRRHDHGHRRARTLGERSLRRRGVRERARVAGASDAFASIRRLRSSPSRRISWRASPAPRSRDSTTHRSGNPITDAGATLGRVLFYDPRLSANDGTSCASCHRQSLGFADALPRSARLLRRAHAAPRYRSRERALLWKRALLLGRAGRVARGAGARADPASRRDGDVARRARPQAERHVLLPRAVHRRVRIAVDHERSHRRCARAVHSRDGVGRIAL